MTLGKEGQGPNRGFIGTPGFRQRSGDATRKTFEAKKTMMEQPSATLGDRIMARLAKPHKVVSRDAHREKALSPEQEAIARQIDRLKGEG